MNSISLPSATPTTPSFGSWSPLYSVSFDFAEKRRRLNGLNSNNSVSKLSVLSVPTALKPAPLTPRKLSRAQVVTPASAPKVEAKSAAATANTAAVKGAPNAMVSSMLKTQKPESPSALKARALNLPRLNINTAAAKPLSPLSASKPAFKRRAPPPPLNIGTSANCSPSSPSSPFLPKTPRAAVGNHTFSGFGEASPSLYDLPTPEPVSWAPSLAVVPPTPTPVTEHSDAKNANMTENIAASLRSEPCTPPWPKRGASLRTTLFDHIGQKHLSPMDLRGYMSASLRK